MAEWEWYTGSIVKIFSSTSDKIKQISRFKEESLSNSYKFLYYYNINQILDISLIVKVYKAILDSYKINKIMNGIVLINPFPHTAILQQTTFR